MKHRSRISLCGSERCSSVLNIYRLSSSFPKSDYRSDESNATLQLFLSRAISLKVTADRPRESICSRSDMREAQTASCRRNS